jgi:hypothetical protein
MHRRNCTRAEFAPFLVLLAVAACGSAPRATIGADDLFVGEALALRYVHEPYDAQRVRETCKVWHELHAPDGRTITKGLGGEYEHHRGLFFGFNQTKVGGKKFDFWHCNKGEAQRHAGFCAPSQLGLGNDWQVAQIEWTEPSGTIVVSERRALRVRAIDERTWRFDFVSELAADRDVTLSGDPQHSGCQFRALAQFAEKGSEKVRYVRPSTAVAHANDVWTNCQWIAAILPLDGDDVTVLRVEMPGNPDSVQWSTRDYGRFGATFEQELKPGVPLRVRYAYVVAIGSLDEARCETLAAQVTSTGGSGSGRAGVR